MKTTLKKILPITILVICLCYLAVGLFFKPIICNDAINGMLSLNNYLNGAHWNQTLNLSKDGTQLFSHELTWWAPGQYEIPYVFSKICFTDIGVAVTILAFFSIIGGCYYYFRVFKLSGINGNIIYIALLILVLQRFLNVYFTQYDSSDIILFFFTPFYLYLYHKFLKNYQQRVILKLLILTILNVAGLFIKSSFILFELAVNIFFFIEYFFLYNFVANKDGGGLPEISFAKKIILPLPFLVANFLNYIFFLRLGTNPTLSPGTVYSISNILEGIFLPLTHILFSSVSLSGVAENFYDKIHFSDFSEDLIMLLGVLLFLLFVYTKRVYIITLFKSDYLFRLITITALMYLLFWLVFTIRQSDISNEDRLFLPVTILLFPYLLNASFNSSNKIKFLYFIMVGFSVIYGISSFANRIKKHNINGSILSESRKLNGFRIFNSNENASAELRKIDSLINTHFQHYPIIETNPNLAFALNVPNQFAVINDTTWSVKSALHPNVPYIIMAEVGEKRVPPGLETVYRTEHYIIYRSR